MNGANILLIENDVFSNSVGNEVDRSHEPGSKQIKKKSSMPDREIMDEKLYQKLLKQPKNKKQQLIHFYRFKLFLILARHTGLRAGDIGLFTQEKIEDILKTGQLTLEETKTKKERTLYVSEKALKELSEWRNAITYVFEKQETLMGTPHSKNWIRFINKCLIEGTKGMNLYIRSDSMRATYITHLLKHYPVQNLRSIVNHKSILTTQLYEKYVAEPEKLKETLEML